MKHLYPAVRRSAASYVLHGKTIPEPYDYLEEPTNEEAKSFVAAQNDYFKQYMTSSGKMKDLFFDRLTAMQDYARTGNPSLYNGNYYYFHNTGLQNQSVLMRVKDLKDETPEVFLDPNTMSSDGTTALKGLAWSEDEKTFAYSVSDKGSDWQRILVRSADAKVDQQDEVRWAKFTGISWWHNDGFFYTRYPALPDNADEGAETDSAKDAFICFHRLNTSQDQDVVVLKVPDNPMWNISATVSDCHGYLVVGLSDGREPYNRVWVAKLPASVADIAQPLKYTKLVDTFVASYDYLGNNGEVFYFTSTKDAPRKKVISINLNDGHEVEVVPEQASTMTYASLVQQTLLLVYLEDVKDTLYYRTLEEKSLHKVDLPIGTIASFFAHRRKNFVSFKVTSFLLPGRTFVADITNLEGSLQTLKDDTVEGFAADDYVTEQKFYHSKDGTRIPMFIVRRKGPVSETSPVLLYGYGGFNISLTPSFSVSRLVFLRHLGGVVAIPNIRGGGEYGEAWHDAGRRANKQNCFTDFITAAEFLHENRIGSPATTAIMGGSNGGLLVAAVANEAPHLMSCVICQVGVLDMYKFHKFTIGHAWMTDYGDPDNEEDFKVLEKYSPLHNIRANIKYPAIMVVTGDHDDRVVPLHSLKYVATLQHTNPEMGGPFVARIEVSAGHGAGKPTSKILNESADIYTFVSKHVHAAWTD